MRKVLHVLSQRPSLTGSGVTLEALVREFGRSGSRQAVVVGVPHLAAQLTSEPREPNPSASNGWQNQAQLLGVTETSNAQWPSVGGLPKKCIHPLWFERAPLSFALPGMSDVMPYRSTRFSELTERQLETYLDAWRCHLTKAIREFSPDIIHSHHVWLVSSLMKDLAPQIPIVTHCHATGLRQMELCPHLRQRVVDGCARNERFVVLHEGHAASLQSALGLDPSRITLIGAGYRADIFRAEGARPLPWHLVYVGKYAASKGLPWLLDALERLAERHPEITLHVAGDGTGAEAEALRRRMQAMVGLVVLHGQLTQPDLAKLMRRCSVCVLPSFYEGVPLVLVEAAACGCQIVATRLPGILNELAQPLGKTLELIPLPPMTSIDTPSSAALPEFTAALCAAIEKACLEGSQLAELSSAMLPDLAPFSWSAVARRVSAVYDELLQP